jgi:hypothetical protein
MELKHCHKYFSTLEGAAMRVHLTLLVLTVIAAVPYVIAAPQQSQKGDKPHEKREHTVYILDKGFSSNEQGFGTLVLVLDALPGNTNIIRVINKSASPHGFKIEINNQSFGLDNPVAPGKTAQFEFIAPPELRGNTGKFYSPVGDDRKRGFEGRVTLLSEAEGG